jgi:PAS domain S-box-containing protein
MWRSLTARTAAALAVLAALIIGGFVLLMVGVQRLDSEQRTGNRALTVLAVGNTLQSSVLDMQSALRAFVEGGDRGELPLFREAVSDYREQAPVLARLTAGVPSLHGQALAIDAAIAAYLRGSADPLIRLAQRDPAAARRLLATGTLRRQIDRIRQRFARLDSTQLAQAAADQRAAQRTASLTLLIGGSDLAVCVLLLVAFVVSTQVKIVRPVRRLKAAARRLREGDLTERVPVSGDAEVAELAAAFNVMAADIEAARDEVEQQNAELQGQQVELESALTEVEQQRERAEAAHRFSAALVKQSGMEEVAALALREIADHAHAEVGALYLLDEQSGSITLRASRGARVGDFPAALPPDGSGLAGRAVAEQRPLTVSYPETSLQLPGLIGDRQIRHELHLPLLQRGRPIGVLSLGRAAGAEFTAADTAALAEFAQTASLVCAEAMVLRRVEVMAAELETVMDSTDEGIYRRDLAGRISYVNRAALEQTGYRAEELLGQDAHAILHHTRADGSPYPAAECPMQRVTEDGAGARFSGEVFWRKDGTPFPIDCSAYPFFDAGEVSGVVVTFRDITEQKLAEVQLEAQYQTARALATAGSVEEVRSELRRIFCEQLGWRVWAVWTPDEHDEGRLRCHTAEGQPGAEDDIALLQQTTLAPGQGAVGRAWQLGEPVYVAGPDGQPADGQPADGRSPNGRPANGRPGTGRPAEGRPAEGRLAEGRLAEGLLAERAAGQAAQGELAVPYRRHGQLVAVTHLLGPAGPVTDGMIATVETITAQVAQFAERKETEVAASRIKDQFVSTVSHELRTPLAAMDGWLHILLDGEPGPLTDEQRRFLGTVKRNSDRLMRLVGDLLLIGQMDAGRFSLDIGEVDLAELVTETVALFAGPAAEKRIELAATAAPGLTVRGDRLRLSQMLSNLVSNAIKFTPEGGTVGVRVSEEAGRCRIEVTDSGVGIPPAERGHLFERFYRASTAAGVAGTGLGLAISKAIVEGHGGTIGVADADGGGTRFVVELPLLVRAEANA